jgi:hypothetical protein
MKGIGIVAALILLFAGGIFAQQDPRDPGMQDSVIVGSATAIDSSDQYQFRMLPIYVVTDDSVAFYNCPIRWIAPMGGVSIGVGTQYFPPVNQWVEHFDSIITAENYIRQFGWADLDSLNTPLLITNSLRLNTWTIRVIIAPYTPGQLVEFDTCYDNLNGPLLFGIWGGATEFVPAFQKGFLSIEPLGVDEPSMPTEYLLSQNYPNPFNPTTTIEFSLPSRGQVTLEVFNLLGQRVRVLADGLFEPGRYTVTWDGADERGNPVSSGAYFYRLNAAGFDQMKRMVLLK